MRDDILEEMNNSVRDLLDKGVIFWQQPWTSESIGFHIPINASTGKAYQGTNIFLINAYAQKYKNKTDKCATYLQWKELGEQVRKDEKGTPIIKYDIVEKKDKEGNVSEVPYLKKYTVFNQSQLYSFKGAEPLEPRPVVESIEIFDQFIANTGAIVKTSEELEACYDLAADIIYMPPKASFIDVQNVKASVNFCGVLGHEANHWTSHPLRLDRKLDANYGTKGYSEEELVAEFGTVLLLKKLNIIFEPPSNSVAYAAGWSRRFGDDPGLFMRAATAAGKSVDYLFSLQKQDMSSQADQAHPFTPEHTQGLRL